MDNVLSKLKITKEDGIEFIVFDINRRESISVELETFKNMFQGCESIKDCIDLSTKKKYGYEKFLDEL